MEKIAEQFNSLHPTVNLKAILRTDECKLISCWLDYGEPTIQCQHHPLANSKALLKYANNTFPVELSQPYIDAALLNHGQYNCRTMGRRGKQWLDVSILTHSPLFDVYYYSSYNYSISPEVAHMTKAYLNGYIKNYTSEFKAREQLIEQLQNSTKYSKRYAYSFRDIIPSCIAKKLYMSLEDEKHLSFLLTNRKHYYSRIRARKRKLSSIQKN